MINDFERKTRKVFHKIHLQQSDNRRIFKRLSCLLNTDYLQLDKNYFNNKICLDAGCGSSGHAIYAMLKMGAKRVYGFDLNKTIFEKAPMNLSKFKGKYDLNTGNVLKMKFCDDFFDFVHCSGVLHHTINPYKGIKELYRVTKKGGLAYILINGRGGLIREITNFLRKKYKYDKKFRAMIDNLDQKEFKKFFNWLSKTMGKHSDFLGRKLFLHKGMLNLFDIDLILTIKDRITAPNYLEFDEVQLRAFLSKIGFKNIKRLNRYPRFTSIRRFFAPFYYEYDNEFSRFLYGDGIIQLIARK